MPDPVPTPSAADGGGSAPPWVALDALKLPLQGSQLIEASAGTGKTWTIAALVLRLIVGHGCPRPLLPGEILVMTFTKAATRELAGRIRERLVQAAARFQGEVAPEGQAQDKFLTALLGAYPPGPSRQEAAWRLSLAAQAMDEAAIHTIDAWCQRMLREHAFDSGSLFDEALQANETALTAQAVRDYWRLQVYPLQGELLDTVLAVWQDPAALAQDVQKLMHQPWPAAAGNGSLADAAAGALRARRAALLELKRGWPARAAEMLAWLTDIWQASDAPTRKKLPRKPDAARWLQAIQDWARSPAADWLELTETARKRLPHAAIAAAFDVHSAISMPSGFAQFEALLQGLEALPDPGPALRQHAAAQVQARLAQLKSQGGLFGFSDLLDRLDLALDENAHAADGRYAGHAGNAQRLRERILAQYPVALIDEFQDTSPVQLRIVDRLYRIADNEPCRALLLIGDPKQAIYGFRGADIYSYLWARHATQGRHHVLGVNYRSTPELVGAVNHLFGSAETRPGAGAFLFRPPLPATGDAKPNTENKGAADSPMPFVAVQAQGRAERLVCATGPVPPLTWVLDEALHTARQGMQLFAAHGAERIVTLLNDPQAGFAQEGQPFKRLRPADVAVLVRTGREAEAVREALRKRGVASVYLSDKDTVFQTPEAADLLRLLQAVAAPRDGRLARAALATPLLGQSLPALLELAQDDEAFDALCAHLEQLHGVWRTQGVLALLRRALQVFDLPARWLASDERRLTNVLHLAELLQSASTQVPGEHALIHWLTQQIQDSAEGLNSGDDVIVRLESDAELVQVVTVHKSKGLEYPLVFLPFPALVRDGRKDLGAGASFLLPQSALEDSEALRPSAAQAPTWLWQPTAQQKEQKRLETLREDTRLLYVALTRAQHALWVGLAGFQPGNSKRHLWHQSAIGCLLSGPEWPGAEPTSRQQHLADVQQLAQGRQDMLVQTLADGALARAEPQAPLHLLMPSVTALAAREPLPTLLPARPYQAAFDRSWAISSYSALVRDAAWEPGVALAWSTRIGRDDEARMHAEAGDLDDGRDAAPTDASSEAESPWHSFPRGALAGNFLHDQLEWLAGEGFALQDSAGLQQALQRRCERQGWGHRAADVLVWLQRLCSTPLPPLLAAQGPDSAHATLPHLHSLAPEMEFWFPSDGLSARQLDALCRLHLLPDQRRPELPERKLKGLLMGFADLVFEHGGRYWVLDYKSNHLGAGDSDYQTPALEAAVLEHRYDVQAALYLLALHRLLKARLGLAYQPAQHLGGALVWFLRGVNSPTAGCCYVAPPLVLLAELDAALNNGANA